MKGKIKGGAVALVLLGGAAAGIATAAGGGGDGQAGSRLDDGSGLLPKAAISEQQAIIAAQAQATGALNEVDLEYVNGRLVFNVDVGASDVKVDAASGAVVAVDHDD
jgi:uncharacterized membrane protein YkoI